MSLSRIAVLGAPVLAAFALVACGGDDSPSPASPDGTSAAGATASVSPGGAASSPSPGSSASASPAATGSPSGASATATPTSGGGSGSPAPGSSAPSTNTVPAGVTPRGPLPTPDARYCDTIGPNSPPNSVLGILKLDGKDAPAGTPVQVLFDGVPGPAEYTRADGGYRVDFGTSSGDCPNKNGAKITLAIDGETYDTGATVGSLPAIRFDIDD